MLLQYVEDNMNNSTLSSMATNAISCLIDIGIVFLTQIDSHICFELMPVSYKLLLQVIFIDQTA